MTAGQFMHEVQFMRRKAQFIVSFADYSSCVR